MNVELTAEEARIIGCLMEKAITTPDQYPLTLNALVNACNQKSSREPVMQLEQGAVLRTARQLDEKFLLSIREGAKVDKYVHRLCNTATASWQFSPAEYAVVTLLLLRGAQTPGELRARSGRLHEFEDNAEVTKVLDALMNRDDGAIVARLPKKAGRQDHEYMHLFFGEIESVPAEMISPATSSQPRRNDRVDELEARVAHLEAALRDLASKLGEELNLAPVENPHDRGVAQETGEGM